MLTRSNVDTVQGRLLVRVCNWAFSAGQSCYLIQIIFKPYFSHRNGLNYVPTPTKFIC